MKIDTIEQLDKAVPASGTVTIEFKDCDPIIREYLLGREGAQNRQRLVREKGLVFDLANASVGKFSVRRRSGFASTAPAAASVPPPQRELKKLGEVHTYSPPKEAAKLEKLLTAPVSVNVGLVGPTGSGKTTMAKYVAERLGRKVYRLNCRGDMGAEVFFGEKTVVVDDATAQNKVAFIKGFVEKAMTEGLNDQGEEVGVPAILLIDEVASMPSHISTAMNPVLECDSPVRQMVIDADGGRIVKSHKGFRIIFTGNCVGRGAATAQDALYTAQGQALDLSLLNRVGAWFKVDYDADAEKRILSEAIGDDSLVNKLLQFRDAVRQSWRLGKVLVPFSTRKIVDIVNLYRIYGEIKDALYYGVFTGLLPEEAVVFNEASVAVGLGDLLAEYGA